MLTPNRTAATVMPIVATSDNLSEMGYIADTAYLKWVQAVVIRHWERFAPIAALASKLWIAVRHAITYHRPGVIDDQIVACTSIKRLKGVRAVFITTFCRGDDLLAEIESTWVCIDRTTQQPKELEPGVLEAFKIG